jgi:CheY-like chemotaxis protein
MAVTQPYILLVEDNPDDEELTLLSLRRNNLGHEIIVVRDGVEAVEFMSGEGQYAGRDTAAMPAVILLDLKLPKLDGLGCIEAPTRRSAHASATGSGADFVESRRGRDCKLSTRRQ